MIFRIAGLLTLLMVTGCTMPCPDDGVACTDAVSIGGVCVTVPVDARCDDGNPCTDDFCDPDDPQADEDGCLHEPVTEVTEAVREACPTITESEREALACTFELLRRAGLSEADAQIVAAENCDNLPEDGIFQEDAEACAACLPVVVEEVYAADEP